MARSLSGTNVLSSSSPTSPTNKGSLACWVNPTWNSNTETNDHYFMEYNEASFTDFVMLFFEGSSQKVWGGWLGAADGRASFFAGSGSIFVAGTWIHVAVAWDLTVPLTTLYINGVSKATAATTVSTLTMTAQGVGNKSFATNGPVAGSMADAALWNVALTTFEILALANGARPYQIRTPSLKGYWPIVGLQSPEPDLSGNAKNLTVSGTALAFGPPVMQFTPRWPRVIPLFQPSAATPDVAGYVENEW